MQKKERKPDPRTAHTQEAIKNAYLSLLESGAGDKITVTSLCKLAKINRSTFYLHFSNEASVFKAIEDEAFEKTSICIRKFFVNIQKHKDLPIDNFKLICKDRAFRIITQAPCSKLTARVNKYAIDLSVRLCVHSGQLETREAIIFSTYIVHGIMGLFTDWLAKDHENFENENKFANKVLHHGASVIDVSKLAEAFAQEIAPEMEQNGMEQKQLAGFFH